MRGTAIALAICCIVICALCCAVVCVAAPPATDDQVARLEGGWHGEDNMTPMGRMPFVMLFEEEADGSLHSRSAFNSETWIDLRFHKDADGRWLLDESAGLEGLGVQEYTLEPVEAPGDVLRWVWAKDPGFLTIDVTMTGERMVMDVTLRGESHVHYDLGRLPAEALPELKRELIAAEKISPEERSIYDAVADADTGDTPAPIVAARAAVTAAPDSADAHLRLGMAIGGVLQSDPMTLGPLYAPEMLQALLTAIELDPSKAEAYHWLAGYYLNAPPIAGGSVDKAEDLANRLAEFDPDGGAALLAQVEQARNGQPVNH